MRTVALISGGKDSCYNMMQCVGAGHTIVALANLKPKHKDELDSYMYQTVGHQGIDLYAEAMGLPLYREIISGVAVNRGSHYKPTENDEVEDLYRLLERVKAELTVEAVAVGAILSDYQRIRVENVCRRLGLVTLAYLWRRNQKELLQEMIAGGVDAIIVKVAALGLDPRIHLGMKLNEIQGHLLVMQEKYGLNVCGEGGEYETFTLDCPLFKKRLVVDDRMMVMHANDAFAPVGYLNLRLHLEPKENFQQAGNQAAAVAGSDFVNDLSDSVFSDISDIELSESEYESIEKLEKEELLKQGELNIITFSEEPDGHNSSAEAVEEGYKYEHLQADTDAQIVVDHQSIFGNKMGWYYVGGIVGEATDTATATEDAMKKLISLLESETLQLSEVCSVNIYMRDMAEYAALNEVYGAHFDFPHPPTRVCVQVPLPANVGLIMDAVVHRARPSTSRDGDSKPLVSAVHVQGISHWAPANIGPYSQAIKVGEVIGTCGQIALVPGSMRLVEGGARRQCALALRHLSRVLRAAHPRAHVRSVVQSVCYMVQGSCVSEARRQLERRTAGAIVQYAAVSALPRGAALEWHAWAHTDNYRFEYEETGCTIGDYKVAITRRWNYENSVSAFVCNVATCSSPSSSRLAFANEAACMSHRTVASRMRVEDAATVFRYALGKMLAERRDKDRRPAVNLRVFYQVWSAPPMSTLLTAVNLASTTYGGAVAATLVPVVALHNAFTFLSVSAFRFDE